MGDILLLGSYSSPVPGVVLETRALFYERSAPVLLDAQLGRDRIHVRLHMTKAFSLERLRRFLAYKTPTPCRALQ